MIPAVMNFVNWLAHINVPDAVRSIGTVRLIWDFVYAAAYAYTPPLLSLLMLVKPIDFSSSCQKHRFDDDLHEMCMENLEKKRKYYLEGIANDTTIWLAVAAVSIVAYRNRSFDVHVSMLLRLFIGWFMIGLVHAGIVYVCHYLPILRKQQQDLHRIASCLSLFVAWLMFGYKQKHKHADLELLREHETEIVEIGNKLAVNEIAILAHSKRQMEHNNWLMELEERVRKLEGSKKKA